MRNLIELLSRFGHILLFLLLEFICFVIIVRFNDSQKEIWSNTTAIMSDGVNARLKSMTDYSKLKIINDSLRLENAKLLEQVVNFRVFDRENSFQNFESDSNNLNYKLIPVTVCNKTIHLRNNKLTLCQGEKDGLTARMGLITRNGIIGMTSACSDNFCKALLITNGLSRVSGLIKGKEYTGNVSWQSGNSRILTMNSVPKYANISLGDTVVTSGYSTMFPLGIPIGIISGFQIVKGQNEYEIEIAMLEDVSTVKDAYAVDYQFKEEKDIINEAEEDE